MLKAMKVPGWLWGEAVTTAVFILNRAPTRALKNTTPYEVWHGTKPAVHFLKVFGCVVHVKNTIGHLHKLADRSTPMVFIGYEPGSKAYRFYNPNTRRVVIFCDAMFDEGKAWDWNESPNTGGDLGVEPFTVEQMTIRIRSGLEDRVPLGSTPLSGVSSHSAPPPSSPGSTGAGRHGEVTPPVPATPAPGTPAAPTSPVEFVSPPSGPLDLDADHEEGAPVRFRALENILGPASPPGLAERGLGDDLLLAVGDELATFEEARGEEC